VISAQNYNGINRYIAKYGYTISGSKIVLRKMGMGIQQAESSNQ
jgi:hypothetical protein